MRYLFAKYFEKIAQNDRRIIFLTGDLGFNAFEPLQETLGNRFINAGVAEHNMVTSAAGLAYGGFKPWIYSFAPFVSIKVLEEIRNDVCLHKANVKIIALGGGFDYAIAGPTHHGLEDVALISTLPNIQLYIPGFSQDIKPILTKMHTNKGPAYLRLTKAHETDVVVPDYQPLRQITQGDRITVVVLGSIIIEVIEALRNYPGKIDLWVVAEMPFIVNKLFQKSIEKTKRLCIIEEHVQIGGLGQFMSQHILNTSKSTEKFIHLFVKGYKSGLYGSRDFYLKENQIDRKSIEKALKDFIV